MKFSIENFNLKFQGILVITHPVKVLQIDADVKNDKCIHLLQQVFHTLPFIFCTDSLIKTNRIEKI